MAEKLYSYADKQVMEEIGSGGGSDGSSGGIKVVEMEGSELKASFNELITAVQSNQLVIVITPSGAGGFVILRLVNLTPGDNNYSASFSGGDAVVEFTADSPEGHMYPA